MAADADHFDLDWLALREPVDHAARAAGLAERLDRELAGRDRLRIVDLGAGTGSNMRWLSPRLSIAQDWLLVDHDPALIGHVGPAPGAGVVEVSVETRCIDLNALPSTCFDGVGLVTASALFDLVSRQWIETLARRLVRCGAAGLFALTVDGRRWFQDSSGRPIMDASDREMVDLFNRHQRRAKGLGEALGPEAASLLPAALRDAGLEVRVEQSDWRLAAGEAGSLRLAAALIEDWARAASEISPGDSARIGSWRSERLDALADGAIGLGVGHVDVLALPGACD